MTAARAPRTPRDYFFGEVLRLPPGVRDPDLYTLLGIPFFESDHGTIVRAAMERIRLLESCQADPRPGYQAALHRLLSEMREAQLTLLDPKRRPEYDARLIGRSEGGAGGAGDPHDSDDEADLKPGTMLAGRYRILAKARPGGFGRYYDALDGNLRTRVQVSVLRPRLSKDRPARRRIEQAARSGAALAHPSILAIDEVGVGEVEVGEVEVGEVEVGEGLLFLRTRPPEGKSLVERIESTQEMRLDPTEARGIARSLAEALAHAHGAGCVHGELRPRDIFVDGKGRVLVCDFQVARAVADACAGADQDAPATRPPEEEASPAGDLFAFGCIAYQMLAGMPPFPAGAATFHPAPLPSGVPEDLELLVMRCLARQPADRPASAAEVVERLTARPATRRLPKLVALAVVLVVVLAAAILASRQDQPESSLKADAWKLVARGQFDAAIASVREALRADSSRTDLHAPLAGALEGRALRLESEGDLWEAQRLLAEAQTLEAHPDRKGMLERVRAAAIELLSRAKITSSEVANVPSVHIDAGDLPLASATVAGRLLSLEAGKGEMTLELEEGSHTLPFRLSDVAGNVREGVVAVTVDRTPPALEILAPMEGAALSESRVIVRVRVTDLHPEGSVTIDGRAVKLVDGVAETTLELKDGQHTFAVAARDRAGHAATAIRAVFVETRAPALALPRKRIVFRTGPIAIEGTLRTPGCRLLIDGEPVEPESGEEGAFSRAVQAEGDRTVIVEATGPTGIVRRLEVALVRDDDAPVLAILWQRRDRNDVLLYGAREMAEGFRVPLKVLDKTALTFEPSEGAIEEDQWVLSAFEGAREVTLLARDEGGNESRLVARVEGHRSVPALEVSGNVKEITSDTELVLDVTAEDLLSVQGEEREPGRIRLPLAEGNNEVRITATDQFGNESVWARTVRSDRTPPVLRLLGDEERGIGRQDLELESDEELASVTCVGRTFEVSGRRVTFEVDLQSGRRSLHVVARDLAGNETKAKFPIRVVNRALELDGRSAVRLSLPEALESFTVECWARGAEATGRQVILGVGVPARFALVWSSIDGSLPYAVVEQASGGILTLPARRAWKWEQWTHLALSCDGKRIRFFVNGSLQAQADLADAVREGGPQVVVGGEPSGDKATESFFRGAIDELRISSTARYTRAFSPAKVHREDEATILLLRFDVLAEGNHPDGSGKGHTAAAVGKPTLVEEER